MSLVFKLTCTSFVSLAKEFALPAPLNMQQLPLDFFPRFIGEIGASARSVLRLSCPGATLGATMILSTPWNLLIWRCTLIFLHNDVPGCAACHHQCRRVWVHKAQAIESRDQMRKNEHVSNSMHRCVRLQTTCEPVLSVTTCRTKWCVLRDIYITFKTTHQSSAL